MKKRMEEFAKKYSKNALRKFKRYGRPLPEITSDLDEVLSMEAEGVKRTIYNRPFGANRETNRKW